MEAFGTRVDGVKTQNTIIIRVITIVSCVSTLALREEDILTDQNVEYNKILIFIIRNSGLENRN